jgi:hypothetical protein
VLVPEEFGASVRQKIDDALRSSRGSVLEARAIVAS